MNVYQCWYFGISGYCCRNYNSKWMFVPELGQINSRIHKHISIHDLVFNNDFAKQYELTIEQRVEKIRSNPLHFIKALLFPEQKANTVGGTLFAAI
jgi:hypothetical protein